MSDFDFTSGFWSWFIIVPTVAGFVGLLILIRWMTTAPAQGEDVGTTGHVWDDDLAEFNNPLPRWWLNMFYLTIAFGVAYLLLYPGLGAFRGLLGWTDDGQYEREMAGADAKFGPLFEKYAATDIKTLIEDPEALKIGQRLFSAYCTTCHGSDAGGVRGFPNLRDQEWLWGGTPETIQATILNGRQAAMPAWKAVVGDEGVLQVAEYVRSLSGRSADAAVAAKGAAVYQQYCIACHGAEGLGNQAMGAPNLTDNVWLYGGSQELLVESIANGRNGRMPAQKDVLGEAKVHLLATYVYSLSVGKHED